LKAAQALGRGWAARARDRHIGRGRAQKAAGDGEAAARRARDRRVARRAVGAGERPFRSREATDSTSITARRARAALQVAVQCVCTGEGKG
jgi:hypothetical protein